MWECKLRLLEPPMFREKLEIRILVRMECPAFNNTGKSAFHDRAGYAPMWAASVGLLPTSTSASGMSAVPLGCGLTGQMLAAVGRSRGGGADRRVAGKERPSEPLGYQAMALPQG